MRLKNKRQVIKYVRTEDLKPRSGNPHIHPKKQFNLLKRLIETIGFHGVILIEADGTIIAGELCWEVCKALNYEEVPTIVVDDLTAAEIKILVLAHNKLSELAKWDPKALGEYFKILSSLDIDIDLELTGFSYGEIDCLIEGLEIVTDDEAADNIPHAVLTPVSKLGDLWLLERHRLLCGSALEPACYIVLMDGKQATTIFTDPPYNVKIQGNVGGLGKVQHKEFQMASGEMSPEEFTQFLSATFALLIKYSKDGSIHFIWMDWRHMREILEAGKAYTELKNLIAWVKDNAGMGTFYRSQHELIFVFKNGDAKHQNNFELGQHGRYRTNVWTYPGINSFSRDSKKGNLLELHPTVKPVALVADAIRDCSRRGDIILDCFIGSGTTIIAAERTGRVCYGVELDPLYIDTAIRRWQRLTGKKAIHAATGLTFDELEAQALVEAGNE